MDILVVLGSNWSSWLGSAATESVASFEHCPWSSSSLWTCYPLIGHWYWEQSLSSLYAAIYTDGLPASLCWVMSRSSITSTWTSTMHHSCCSCLWGFHFHPQSLLWAQHHLWVICSTVTWLWLLFQLSRLVALHLFSDCTFIVLV